jgi:hypothetical protein
MTMTVVRNEPTVPMDLIRQYRNAINSDAFAGYDPYFVKVVSIAPRSVFHQICGWYYQVSYEFEMISPYGTGGGSGGGAEQQGYKKRILSQGLRAISSVTGNRYHITANGIPISQPWLLDQNGYTLPVNGQPYWQIFQVYPELAFSQFNFDPSALTGQRSGFP